MKSVIFTAIIVAFIMISCKPAEKPQEKISEFSVKFKNRIIDLEPYFKGFPYQRISANYETGKILYFKADTSTILMMQALSDSVDLSAGKIISKIDFAKRSAGSMKFRPADNCLYWSGDEINDEVFNLYKMDINTGEPQKITDVKYIFGWNWNEEKNKIAYIVREGTKDERLGEIRVLNLETNETDTIVADNPEMRFSWSSPSWRPDGKGIVVTALKNAHRNFSNLAYIDLENKKMKVITDTKADRKSVYAFPEWLSESKFLYVSNEDGFNNLYSFDIEKMESQKLSNFKIDISEIELIEIEDEKLVFAVISNPIENEFYLIDPENGNIIHNEKSELNVSLLDSKDNKILLAGSSVNTMYVVKEMTVGKEKFESKTIIGIPKELRDKIIHANVKRVQIPTFDIDSATGETRMLHAYLYIPAQPLPEGEKIVIIRSFYGGYNFFSKREQILAESGIYVLSPAPRGSGGFGKEFAALNDCDLGGNEIIDIIYCGKYIEKELGVPPARIGVQGGSHGGYASMRLMTFPGKINGIKAQFDWGFGISHAGFSDIIHFYEKCNIPDWVILEAGDPKTEAIKLKDRSPLYHANSLKGKLLLTHGSNDQRVPVEGSRWMADSLKKYGKDYKYIEFEGQGHPIKGLDNNLKYYKVLFEFLESVGGRKLK